MFGEKVILIVDDKDYECILTYEEDFLIGECVEPFVHAQSDERELVLGKLAIGIRQALAEKQGI